MKRELAPRFWTMHRKETTWAPNPHPGPHPKQDSVPIVMILREMLGFARTSKEAERILSRSTVRVDGKVRKDHRFSVGLMDVIQVGGLDKVYRMLPRPRRGLSLVQVGEGESGYKLCAITRKETTRGGRVQLSLHDGRTILVSGKEQLKTEEAYQVGGTVQVSLPGQKIMKFVPLRVGNLGLVTHGKNEGLHGRIATISPGTNARRPIAKIETGDLVFETPAEYVLPIGTETPLVSLER